jgi:VWFA-related protein
MDSYRASSLRVSVVFATLAGFAALCGAQSTQPAAPPLTAPPQAAPAAQAPPVEPHTISIDVAVTDKQGHSIKGLKQEDFTLLDNKQPRKIVDFHEVDTHQVAAGAADPVQVIIVVDMINTDFTVVAREREQLGEYLKQDGGHLAHPTSLAILTEKGIRMVQASSEDGNQLLTTLEGANSELRMTGRSAGFYGAQDRLNWSLDQLSQLVAYESTKPGRKLAFFLSPGWPLFPNASVDATDKERKWVFGALVGLTNALREAHLTLYSLDPHMLGRTDPFYYQSYLKPVSNVNQAEEPYLGLQVLSAHSGGLDEVTGMDVLGEINTAIRDAEGWYSITFEPPVPDRRNEYHGLQVKVDKPGVVRTTAGYYANVQR